MKDDELIPGLAFDERDGTYLFRRPNGEGGYEYSQTFNSKKEAISAYDKHLLIYTD